MTHDKTAPLPYRPPSRVPAVAEAELAPPPRVVGSIHPAGDTYVADTCVPSPVAASCVPTSSLSALIQGKNVTSYVPKGAWGSSTTGV